MLIKLDSKGRATLPKALTDGHGLYEGRINDLGHIELTPVRVEVVPIMSVETAFGRTGAEILRQSDTPGSGEMIRRDLDENLEEYLARLDKMRDE